MEEHSRDRMALEFHRARWEAMCDSVYSFLRQHSQFRPVQAASGAPAHASRRRSLGRQSVPTYKIFACEGRYADLDRLLPLGETDSDRGISSGDGSDLTPIELYKVEDFFFVKDGNRRVTMARLRGQLFTPAHVVEYLTATPHNSSTEAYMIPLRDEHDTFSAATGLAEVRPLQTVESTMLGSYPALASHIDIYRQELEIESDRIVEGPDAAAHWYDTTYTPVVDLIRRQELGQLLHGRGEAELYLWAMEHRWESQARGPEADGSAPVTPMRVAGPTHIRHRLKGALRDLLLLAEALRRGRAAATACV